MLVNLVITDKNFGTYQIPSTPTQDIYICVSVCVGVYIYAHIYMLALELEEI